MVADVLGDMAPLSEATDRRRRAEVELLAATDEWKRAVRDAATRHTQEQVAVVAGVSQRRVSAIVHEQPKGNG